MKPILLILSLSLLGCAGDYGTVSYARQFGDGKASITASRDSVFVGYRRSLPVPPDGKAVLNETTENKDQPWYKSVWTAITGK